MTIGTKTCKMTFDVVVTGASGFIGSVLLAQCVKNNIRVTGLSRQGGKGLTVLSSYRDSLSSEEAVLIHLAQSRNASNLSYNDEIALCRSLATMRWRHIVYVSSSIVYGDIKEYARKPTEKVVALNKYAKVKLACESIVTSTGGTCLRFANIYGPGMALNSVIADILRQIPGTGELIVKDKTPIRDFLWVEDAARCLISTSILRPGGIFNVGSGTGVSIGRLAELALIIAGENKRSIISHSTTNRLSCLMLDISQTNSILNWSPQVNITEGLTQLFEKKISHE